MSSSFRLDVEPVRLPMALARLHRSLDVDSWLTVDLLLRGSRWEPGALGDVVAGAGFDEVVVSVPDTPGSVSMSVAAPVSGAGPVVEGATCVVARRARTLPDTVGPGMRVLVCGLNPSLVSADAGFGYAGATNRFWKAATESGLVSLARDPDRALEIDGVGITDLVKRATPSAVDLGRQDYVDGATRVRRLAGWLQPGLVLFVGLAGWRTAVDRTAAPGLQPELFGGVPAYVMPSTSGRNASATLADLVDHMRSALSASPTVTP